MSVHEQYGEDLALYALGSLEGGECTSLEKHLEECVSCRRELEELRGSAALLALAASGPRPPGRAKSRLMNAVAREPRTQRAWLRLQWWGALGWVAAALIVVFMAGLWKQNAKLRANAVNSAETMERQRLQLEKARVILETLTADDAQHVSVLPVGTKAPPPEGKAIYSREHNGLIFMASNLHPLPAEKAYELWLIPMQGAPIPAGVFKPDAHGGAMVLNPPLPAGVEAKAFAITIEPEQGSATPTMPIVMMGAGG
jgi:anti-sigma-K factor RskA